MAVSCDAPVPVDADRVNAFARLLDPGAVTLGEGDALPALWHWVALPRWTDPSATGHDGHPKRPGPLADVTAVRRMFAGGEVVFHDRPLHIGEPVTVDTEITDVATKSGRSGEFVLATFTSRITNSDGDQAITERQEVVYTDPRPVPEGATAPSGALPIVGRPLVPHGDGGYSLVTDPTVLMRFSALTANGHRIHYDLGYAREVEKLPGLLVHGPFMNLALTHIACASRPGQPVRRITHRNLSPLYVGQPAVLSTLDESPTVVAAEITGSATEGVAPVKGRVSVEFDINPEGHQS